MNIARLAAVTSIAILGLLMGGGVASGEPAAAPRHLGPIVTLNNGSVVVRVAPAIGRIVGFQRPPEDNWLAVTDEATPPEADYKPWGGDRIWPLLIPYAPQALGHTNFDLAIESGPWTVTESGPRVLEMTSPDSPRLKLRIVRRVELPATGNAVIHRIRLERFADNPFPVQVWAVTSINPADAVLMDRDPRIRQVDAQPYKTWLHVWPEEPRARLFPPPGALRVEFPRATIKIATYGTWIALLKKSSAFLQTIAYDPAAFYPDESSLQFYSEAGRGLHELETLSPSWFLRAGESREWTIRWTLLDFPEDAATDEQRATHLATLARVPLP